MDKEGNICCSYVYHLQAISVTGAVKIQLVARAKCWHCHVAQRFKAATLNRNMSSQTPV